MILAPRLGFEPRTWRLTAARSTIELSGNAMVFRTLQFFIISIAWQKSNPNIWWLPRQESNLGKRIQSPLCYLYTTRHYLFLWCRRSGSNRHESRLSTVFETVASANSATPAKLERKTRFELATSSLARRHSTTELLPPAGAEARNRTGDT